MRKNTIPSSSKRFTRFLMQRLFQTSPSVLLPSSARLPAFSKQQAYGVGVLLWRENLWRLFLSLFAQSQNQLLKFSSHTHVDHPPCFAFSLNLFPNLTSSGIQLKAPIAILVYGNWPSHSSFTPALINFLRTYSCTKPCQIEKIDAPNHLYYRGEHLR